MAQSNTLTAWMVCDLLGCVRRYFAPASFMLGQITRRNPASENAKRHTPSSSATPSLVEGSDPGSPVPTSVSSNDPDLAIALFAQLMEISPNFTSDMTRPNVPLVEQARKSRGISDAQQTDPGSSPRRGMVIIKSVRDVSTHHEIFVEGIDIPLLIPTTISASLKAQLIWDFSNKMAARLSARGNDAVWRSPIRRS
jgi:hypothetical protein